MLTACNVLRRSRCIFEEGIEMLLDGCGVD